MISVQHDDFSISRECEYLVEPGISGAVATFVGYVRQFSEDRKAEFFLQHYPSMTESVLEKIEQAAHKNWPLQKTRIIHRIGKLEVGEQIVFVGVSAAHREAAFAACQYIIDILKTQAPFWKKEGERWVEAREKDNQAAEKWLTKETNDDR